jgi:hypothetical protein
MHGIVLRGDVFLLWLVLAVTLGCGTSGPGEASEQTPVAVRDNNAMVEASTARESVVPNPGDTPPARTGNGKLGDVFASWESGDKDQAVELLLSIQWSDLDLASDTPALRLSEQEFASLSRDERTRVGEEAIKFASMSKQLARHALSLGDQARVSGQMQQGKAYYEAVLRLGECLSNPERLKVLQMMGAALKAMAEKQLSGPN